jgi:hypothetical protein
MTHAIYMHVKKDTQQCYVGITEQRVADRWARGTSYRHQKKFGPSIVKHGWGAFKSYVLAFADTRADLEAAEVAAIAAAGGHKSRFTLNLSPGGDLVAENDRPIVGVFLSSGRERKFKSGSAAARELGFRNIDAPNAVARGERTSKSGWWFRYEDDIKRRPPTKWGEVLRTDRVRQKFGKRVVAINLESKKRIVFDTFSDAAERLKISPSLVSASVRKKVSSAGGYVFFIEGSDETLPALYGSALTRFKRDKAVYAYNLMSGVRKTFRNCSVADSHLSLHAGAASSVASKQRVSAGQWWFTFDKKAHPPKLFAGSLVAEHRRKPVIAVSIVSGESVRFESAKAASIELGMSRAAISKSISSKKPTMGYQFRFPTE